MTSQPHKSKRPPIVIPPPPVGADESAPTPTTYRTLPQKFIHCPKDDLIVIISRMLSSLISINDQQISSDINQQSLTRFHSRSPPQISLYSYLSRLSHYSSLENSVLITSIYYIDLLSMCYPIFAVNSLTVHRFLLTATTVASKALCDSFCSNSHYAKVGGVNLMELNVLETEFLNKVGYRVVPRDFNYDRLQERKSSTGTLDTDYLKKIKLGIENASEVLDLYYKRMVMLVGARDNGTVGCHDDVEYELAPEAGGSEECKAGDKTQTGLTDAGRRKLRKLEKPDTNGDQSPDK
ncbi:hypothetical protein KL921_003309 [Ogataea angusta]|uniref:Cyclin-domain-containing protein n=1 Tax=Pichia angusta TaxID=870730 RepID=A0AAN6I535_PICAN|nr:uncharacterized protein KL928_003547 [Ogataea angusta]KAG7809312.1 hypothetical protein KL921_003309 [Ogataea angusta]KAG7817648.1 hypothetical protein KL928_003547 [Ogataea angusta]KAG7822595.1 hypothetical protein KL909_003760 [Ogataea angusta]KAG7827538.1 hypothetical protein KL920_004301 [Ogataea angusta]KAG7833748.1 hypothetical protein KL943_003856 [Ogataea angusta]